MTFHGYRRIKNQEERHLIEKIQKSESSGDVVTTILKTDEKVIARVTDEIIDNPAQQLEN